MTSNATLPTAPALIRRIRVARVLRFVCLAGLAAPLAAQTQSGGPEGVSAGMDRVGFFIGEWDIESRSPDGSQVVGRARTEVRYILDGRAMQADYYGLDPLGNTVFRGTTIRTYVPATDRYAVHWSMAELPGYTYIDVEYRDGELHGDGRGFDGQGEFLERYRYFDISDEHYSFEMSRSYDGGTTWQPWANLEATKRAGDGGLM
jgi:hypothetical protein